MFEPGRNVPRSTADSDTPDADLLCAWGSEAADEGWLVSYADMLSVVLAMVVLLLGRLVLAGGATEAAPVVASPADAPVLASAVDRPLPAVLDDAPVATTPASVDPPNLDSLLLPEPVPGRPALGVADTGLALRTLPDVHVLLVPDVTAGVSPVATRPPELDALDLPPWPTPTSSDAETTEAAATSSMTVDRERRLALSIERRFRGKVVAEPEDSGVLLTIADVVLFGSARADLASPAKQMLTDLAETLRAAGDVRVSVEGHTDNRPIEGGEFASNWDLAAARANAVTRFLLARGFDAGRVHSVSYADTRPVADNGTTAGRAANRRVELRIEFPDDAGPELALAQAADDS